MSVIHLSSLFLCDDAFVASCSFRFAFSVFATSVPFSSVLSLFAVIVNICAFLWLLHPCIRLRSTPASHHHSFPDPNFTRVLSCKISIFHSVFTPQFAPTSVFISSCFKYLKFFFFFFLMCLVQLLLVLELNFIWVRVSLRSRPHTSIILKLGKHRYEVGKARGG